MNGYSYHTVSSIINAFKKNVNFPFKLQHKNVEKQKVLVDDNISPP